MSLVLAEDVALADIAAKVRGLVVTLGEAGCEVYEGGQCTRVAPVRAAAALDPTGCGDAFRGGLLYGLERGWSLARSAALGNHMGATKIAHLGPQNYTIDAAVAADTVRLLRPRVTIPMHYRTIYNADMPITDEKPFLSLMNAQPTPMPVCRLSYGDMSERPDVILLDITATSAA